MFRFRFSFDGKSDPKTPVITSITHENPIPLSASLPARAETSKTNVLHKLSESSRNEKAASKSAQQVLQLVNGVEDPKAIKKLKSNLASPKQARLIITQLKALPLPSSALSAAPHKAICLAECEETHQPSPTFINLITSIPSPGTIAASAAQASGALDSLAVVSSMWITHDTSLQVPLDRMSLFVYFWGYEIAIPKESIKVLAAAHSASSTFFSFLQVITATGGAPELTPFIRYLSAYIDMEWRAITAQDRGQGVCLAATWILPVAIIPRPWDFPVSIEAKV